MAVDVPTSDDLPILPPDAAQARPTIAGQQHQHAADQPPADDNLPLAPQSILSTSFGPWEQFTHGLGLGTRNVIEGVSALPAMAADVATWPGRAAIRALGGSATAPSDMLSAGLDALKMPTPRTFGEQVRAEAVRSGAGMLPTLGIGAAPSLVAKLPMALRPLVATEGATSGPLAAGQVMAGGLGGAGGELAQSSDLVPEWLKPTARMAGNITGAGIGSGLAGSIGTLTNAATGVNTDIAAALKRLEIEPKTVGAVSGSPSAQTTEAIFSRAPISGGMLQPKQQSMVDQFGTAVDATANKLGKSATAAEAGSAAQGHIRDWISNTWPTMEDNAWRPVNSIMKPAGDVVDLSNYRTALERAAYDARLTNMPTTQSEFASDKIKGWLKALNDDAPPGSKISWDAAQAIQQQLGDAMSTPDIVGSIGSNRMKSLYASLAQDRQVAAVLGGAGREYDAANAVSTAGRTFMDNTLSKAVTGKNPLKESISGDQAATALLGGTAEDLQHLRLLVPKAADELAAYKLRSMAQARAGQQGAEDTTSTGTFLTNLRGSQLRNPEGTAALFSDPAVAQKVSDLGAVADQFRSVQKNMNAPNTGVANLLLSLGGQLGAGVAAGGGLKTAAGILGGNIAAPIVVGKYLTNPLAIKLAAAQRGTQPVSGLLGGALANVPAISPEHRAQRYNYDVTP